MGFRVRGLQRDEVEGFLACFQAAFGVDDPSLSIIRNSLVNDPYFRPERVRVGVMDGQIISHVVILHRPTWAGSQVIELAGITAVATHPDYQGRGYGTRVLRDALKLVRRWKYDVALVTTRVPGFFARLGFLEVPAVIGHQCPARGLERMRLSAEYQLAPLDYHQQWPTLAAIYREYSHQRTGMQYREDRFWETWPLRGTFPLGFSNEIGGMGLTAFLGGQMVAYLAAQMLPEIPHLSVTEFAHANDHPEAMLVLLQEAARRFLQRGGRRVMLYTGGAAPVLKLLEDREVPVEGHVAQGLMIAVTNRKWVRASGFGSVDEAIQNLFHSAIPVMWHRDGY